MPVPIGMGTPIIMHSDTPIIEFIKNSAKNIKKKK
jgi:hypothetical protein